MKKVVVASENPVKIEVARQAFTKVFPDETFEFIGVKSDSGVSDQPFDDAVYDGALNRLEYIKKNFKEADYYIAQEGGLHQSKDGLYNHAWILASDKTGAVGRSCTTRFYLPKKIVEEVLKGNELGVATDIVFGDTNSKQKSGIIGYITDGIMGRVDLYIPAGVIAVSSLKHNDWF